MKLPSRFFTQILGLLMVLGGASLAFAQGFQQTVLSTDISSAWATDVADIDGDGDLDVAASGVYGNASWIETRPGQWVTHSVYYSGLGVRGIAAGDFDGDGLTDLVVAANGENRFVFLHNTGQDGNGRFQESTLASGCNGAWSVHKGDVNGDGLLDVVTVEWNGNVARVFEQRNGHLVQVGISRVPTRPTDAVFGDLNGDGRMDVVGSSNDGTLWWLEQGAADTTWTRHDLPFGDYCTEVLVADLDSNGTADILAAPYSNNQFAWWQHTGDTTFVQHNLSGTVTHPRSVAVADLDLDGRPDIIASAQDGTMHWWHNSGGGVFDVRTMPASSSVYGITVSDFDQDGDPDVIASDYALSEVLLYRNTMGIPAVVTGTVRSALDNSPISGVRVRLVQSGASGLSNSSGVYYVAGIAGNYTLQADRVCFNSVLQNSVQIARGETTHVDLTMTQPVMVPGVTSLNLVVHNGIENHTPLPVSNSGDGPMTVTATAHGTYANDTWLSVEPESVSVAMGQNFNFNVTVHPDTSNSGNWDYYGSVELHTNACPDSLLSIGVIAYVLDAPQSNGHVPLQTAMHNSYPNPFNATTTLNFDLAAPGNVRLELFDITGRVAKTLVSTRMAAGEYRMPLNAADLPSGVYVLALHAGSARFSQKLLLIK